MSLALSACLAPGPPDFEQPSQLGPFFLLNEALPPISEIPEIEPQETITFSVPFVSEDAGESLVGARHRDLGDDGEFFLRITNPIPASTLDDPAERVFVFAWTPRPEVRGCHTITLFLTHRSNMDQELGKPINAAGVATATWRVIVGDPGERFLVDQCGQLNQSPAGGNP